MKDFDERIKRALHKGDDEDTGSSFLDFDFNNAKFLGKNMALRNKTSNNIVGGSSKRKRLEED